MAGTYTDIHGSGMVVERTEGGREGNNRQATQAENTTGTLTRE